MEYTNKEIRAIASTANLAGIFWIPLFAIGGLVLNEHFVLLIGLLAIIASSLLSLELIKAINNKLSLKLISLSGNLALCFLDLSFYFEYRIDNVHPELFIYLILSFFSVYIFSVSIITIFSVFYIKRKISRYLFGISILPMISIICSIPRSMYGIDFISHSIYVLLLFLLAGYLRKFYWTENLNPAPPPNK